MRQALRIIVVLLLVALIPARAMGSVTLSVCAAGQEQLAMEHHSGEPDAHEHRDHQGNEHGGHETGHSCGHCAAHCAGVAFAVAADAVRLAPLTGPDMIPFGLRLAPAFLPDLLDRPPLAS